MEKYVYVYLLLIVIVWYVEKGTELEQVYGRGSTVSGYS